MKIHSYAIRYFCVIFLIITLSPAISLATEDIPDEYEGVYIVIDKDEKQLHVYLNDIEMYRFPIATGKQASDTPTGLFLIVTKVKQPWYLPKNIAGGSPQNPLGTRWMGLNVPQTNGYKYGLHGTNNPASIGSAVSQGCIRLRNEHIEFLYEHIHLGTYVKIID